MVYTHIVEKYRKDYKFTAYRYHIIPDVWDNNAVHKTKAGYDSPAEY